MRRSRHVSSQAAPDDRRPTKEDLPFGGTSGLKNYVLNRTICASTAYGNVRMLYTKPVTESGLAETRQGLLLS
jgi:hypothetical protein